MFGYLQLNVTIRLICDNEALVYVFNAKKKINSRLSRWVESLLQLPYEVEFCKGGDNVIADALTRMYGEGGESLQSENVETPSNGIYET